MKKLIALFIMTLLLAGCVSTPKLGIVDDFKDLFSFGGKGEEPEPTTKAVVLESIELEPKSKQLKDSSKVIAKKASSPIVIAETGKIDNIADSLIVDQASHEAVLRYVEKLEETVRQRDEAIVALQNKDLDEFRGVLGWGLKIGALMSIIGVIATIVGGRIPMMDGMGLTILSAGVGTLVISYTLMTKITYFIPVGVLVILGLLGFSIWRAIKTHHKQKEKEEVALDLVRTVEHVKHHGKFDREVIAKLQSPKTQKIVKEHKTKHINNSI